MSVPWQYQLRVYLDDDLAEAAREGRQEPAFAPLEQVLSAHDARLMSQWRAFQDYVAEAEREGVENFPLYKWTKATVEDEAMRAKHGGAFALHVGGREVYPQAAADALETALRPLVGGPVVRRMSRHDTNPDNNIPVPAKYRS